MRLRLGVTGGQITIPPFGWKQFGTSSNDVINGITKDSSGNIYIVGTTSGSLPNNTSSGLTDAFLAKYSPAGILLYIQQLGSSGNDQGTCITYDPNTDNIYIGGIAGGSIQGQSHSGGEDGFIAKYNSSGTLQFVRLVGSGAPNDGILAITYYNSNIYVGGYAGASVNGQVHGGGTNDYLFMKYDTSGNMIFTQLSGQASDDKITAIVPDTLNGNIKVVGEFTGTFAGNAAVGLRDIFVRSFSTSGGTNATSTSGNSTNNDFAYGIISDPVTGNFFICGTTYGSMPGNTLVGTANAFISKYNNSCTRLNTTQFGPSSATTEGKSIAFNADYSQVVCTGTTTGTFSGNTSAGGTDIFTSICLSSNTAVQSTVQTGSSGTDIVNSITYSNNYYYIAGSTTGALSGSNAGGTDAFVGRLSLLGSVE